MSRFAWPASAVAFLAAFVPLAHAQRNVVKSVEAARSAGLAFLAQQQADDGSFASGAGRAEETGAALLSLLASGQVQDQGRYGLIVRRAVQFLVREAEPDLDHPQATLALIEAFGVEPDPRQRAEIRSAIEREVGRLSRTRSVDDDPTRIAWRILALRAARKIGLGEVSEQRLDEEKSRLMSLFDATSRSFRTRNGASEVSPQATAAAVLALTLLDAPQRQEVTPAPTSRPTDLDQPMEVHFLTIQAAVLDRGENWKSIYNTTCDRLIARQGPDGAWPARRDELAGRVHATSLAVLTSSAPARVLPSLQR